MHRHQHIDVLVDRLQRGRIDRAHLEQLAPLLVDRPGLAHLPRCRIEPGRERQARKQADHRFLRRLQFMDQLGDVVFKERLLVRLQERNRCLAVGGVGSGEAEEHLVAGGRHRHRLQAEAGCTVLVLGKRQGIDHFEPELAARARSHFLQHLAHAGVVGAQLRQFLGALVRVEQVQADGFLDRAEDVVRPVRQRVEVVLREIGARAAEHHVDQQHHRDEQHGQHDQRRAGKGLAIECHVDSLLRPLSSCR